MLDWPKLPLWVKLPSLEFCSGYSAPPLPFGEFSEVSPEFPPPFGVCGKSPVAPCPGVLGEGCCTVPFDSPSLFTPWITILLGVLDHNSIRSPTLYV